eukprot:1157108-Pelagomonas_calceolata.AAC.8
MHKGRAEGRQTECTKGKTHKGLSPRGAHEGKAHKMNKRHFVLRAREGKAHKTYKGQNSQRCQGATSHPCNGGYVGNKQASQEMHEDE